MTQHLEDPHGDFARAEAAALIPDVWDLWIATAQTLIGHSLDGDEDKDGYSLDFAYVAAKSGLTPREYVDLTNGRKALRGARHDPA